MAVSVLGRRIVDAVPVARRAACLGLGRLGVEACNPIGYRLAGHIEADRIGVPELPGAQWQAQMRQDPREDVLTSNDGHWSQARMAARAVQDVELEAMAK